MTGGALFLNVNRFKNVCFYCVNQEGRTCLHYTAANKDPEEMYDLLVKVGANTESIDIHGRKPAYYLTRPEELDIEGPYANRTSYNNSNTGRSFSRGGGGGGGGGANNRLGRRISPISPKSTGNNNNNEPLRNNNAIMSLFQPSRVIA